MSRREICCALAAEFLAPLAGCAFAFTYERGIYQRNLQWSSEGKARAYCEEHGHRFTGQRAKDGIRWETPILLNTTQELVQFVALRKPLSIHVGATFIGGANRDYALAHDLVEWPLRADLDIDLAERAKLVSCPCGTLRKCCNVCWRAWVVPRLRQLLHFFTALLGYQRVLMVYSGRRGVHFWIMDPAARTLTMEQRKRIPAHVRHLYGIELDADVTWKPGHLCKAPLYPHAETGRLTVPIALDQVDTFEPESVPTLETVTDEQLAGYGQIFKGLYL